MVHTATLVAPVGGRPSGDICLGGVHDSSLASPRSDFQALGEPELGAMLEHLIPGVCLECIKEREQGGMRSSSTAPVS